MRPGVRPTPGVVAFVWALAEATVWPIMPDAVLVPLAIVRPDGWRRQVVGAVLGSTLGGAVSYAIGRRRPTRGAVARLPLVRPAMIAAVDDWLSREGPRGVLRQPFSGVPFKVFARRAGSLGTPPVPFLGWALLGRGARFLVTGGLTALLSRRFAGPIAPWRGRLILAWSVLFGLGLWRTVARWERRTSADDVARR